MRCFAVSLLALVLASTIPAQQQVQQQADSNRPSSGASTTGESNPQAPGRLGAEDLVSITVYDSPELTRNVRVDAEGDIRLPMVRQRIHAAGLVPAELEDTIAAALVDEQVMVSPIVSVSVVEYHSRPITVVGAVKNPTTFQASGSMTLLEAIVRAGGLSENAGAEILVTHPSTLGGGRSALLTERIPVRSAMDISDPASSLKLEGGENIRVPDAGQVFVVGNVKHPGPIRISDGTASVLKAITLSGGLDSFSSKTAYIYRVEATGASNQIPIEIKKIMTMKSPDVPLYGNDTLYVPNATGQRISAKALSITFGLGLGVAALLVYVLR